MNQSNEKFNARILEHAEMLINVQSNYNMQKESVLDVFQHLNDILRDLGAPRGFQSSIKTSKDCFEDLSKVPSEIQKLKPNNDDSFIIFPLLATGHLFSSVIRKREENGHEKYSLLVVNLGGRSGEKGNHEQYEEFVFNSREKLMKALDFSRAVTPVSKVYASFNLNSDEKYINTIKSRDQIVGNCYLKEVEKGIKAALIPYEDVKSSRITYGNKLKFKDDTQTFDVYSLGAGNVAVSSPTLKLVNKDIKPVTAKYRVKGITHKTEFIHKAYLEMLAKQAPEVADKLKSIHDSYSINKQIRAFLKHEKPLNLSVTEINKNIDYKTMMALIIEQSKAIMNGKRRDFGPLKEACQLNKLVIKTYQEDPSVVNELFILPQKITKKYPRLIESIKKEVSSNLAMTAQVNMFKFINTENPYFLQMSEIQADASLNLYKHSFLALQVKGLQNQIKGDGKVAEKYMEDSMKYVTQPETKNLLEGNLLNVYINNCFKDLLDNNLQSSLTYLKKLSAYNDESHLSLVDLWISKARRFSKSIQNHDELKDLVKSMLKTESKVIVNADSVKNMAKTLENLGNIEYKNGDLKAATSLLKKSSEFYFQFAEKHCDTVSEKIYYFNKVAELNPMGRHSEKIEEFMCKYKNQYDIMEYTPINDDSRVEEKAKEMMRAVPKNAANAIEPFRSKNNLKQNQSRKDIIKTEMSF